MHPLGEITDEAIRTEFQNRGSPHAHCVLWVKGASKFGENPDGEVCNFIDKYIACNIPNDNEKLKELVLLVQQHKHLPTVSETKSVVSVFLSLLVHVP